MKNYSVKEIADALQTNQETVRRWIRSGKLLAEQGSRKTGNIITEEALTKFVKEFPKYSAMAVALTGNASLALGGIIASVLAKAYASSKKVTAEDIERVYREELSQLTSSIIRKQETISQLTKEIEQERQEVQQIENLLNTVNFKDLIQK